MEEEIIQIVAPEDLADPEIDESRTTVAPETLDVVPDSSFEIDGFNSVPVELFNVLVPGKIEIDLDWIDEDQPLTATLEGRRRPELEDPTAPYAEVTGISPLKLTYEVTEEDIERGVGWRLVIEPGNFGSNNIPDVSGNIYIDTPFVSPEVDAAFQRDKISLRSGDILPSSNLEEEFFEQLDSTSAEGLHGIITFNQTPTPDDDQILETVGIDRQSFLPNDHVFSFVDGDFIFADPDIARLIKTFTPLEPEDKITPDILVGNYQEYFIPELNGNYVLNDDGTLRLSVLFSEDTSFETITAILSQEAVSFSEIERSLWDVNITEANLIDLASFDQVEWIDPGFFPDLIENSNTRPVVNTDITQDAQVDGSGNLILSSNLPIYNGLTGNGITVGVQDNGIDASHLDLNVVIDETPPFTSDESHGTHVAGIIAGNGSQSDKNDSNGNPNGGTPFQWRGVAPDSILIDSPGSSVPGNSSSAIYNKAGSLLTAIDQSLDVSNISQIIENNGVYGTKNRMIDRFIAGNGFVGKGFSPFERRIPKRPLVIAAGNNGDRPNNNGSQSGYFSVTNQLKNAVVVGNWNASDGDGSIANDNLNPSSSMGPAHDGRIKPDIVAPGTRVVSTQSSAVGPAFADNSYTTKTGTSMAAPVVAGIEALLLEGSQNTYLTPANTSIDVAPPLPSTLRAILIQTAIDIVDNDVRGTALSEIDSDSNSANGNDGFGRATATPGPDYATGWGFVDAEAAIELMQDSRQDGGQPVANRIVEGKGINGLTQGNIKEFEFIVDQDLINSGDPLKLTLAWDDVEASAHTPNTDPKLVNDLDLELVAPDGTVYYPWQLGHTILDASGNPLADNAQPPGTKIQVSRSITPTETPKTSNDYVPANALTGNGDWVARRGKDHLNNVEQVQVDTNDLSVGRWTARIIGFNVQSGSQDYSLVGIPSCVIPVTSPTSDLPPYEQVVTELNLGNINAVDGEDIYLYNNDSNTGSPALTPPSAKSFALSGADQIDGFSGDDFLFGNKNNDVIDGKAGNDVIFGGQENDMIFGGDGNDTLLGDAGADMLTGGTGSDTFVLQQPGSVTAREADIIMDFENGIDRLMLPSGVNDYLQFTFTEICLEIDGNMTESTAIEFNGSFLALVQGISPSQLDANDFVPEDMSFL